MSPGSNKLDRRPTSVLVAGFDLEDKEEIIKHFTKFGEIADSVEDEVGGPLLRRLYSLIIFHIFQLIPSIILKFKSRPSAEAAMTQGMLSRAVFLLR